MVFDITTPELAKEMMSYFNYFHDGVIIEIKFTATPEPPARFGYVDPLVYTASIIFAHENYKSAPAGWQSNFFSVNSFPGRLS